MARGSVMKRAAKKCKGKKGKTFKSCMKKELKKKG